MAEIVAIMLFRYISYLLQLVMFSVSHNISLRLLSQICMVYSSCRHCLKFIYIIIAVHLVDFYSHLIILDILFNEIHDMSGRQSQQEHENCYVMNSLTCQFQSDKHTALCVNVKFLIEFDNE